MIKVDDSVNQSNAALFVPSFLAICFLIEIFIAQCWHPLRIGHDQALYLQCGFLLLHGGTPYVDFMDSNPPLIFYVNTLPAFISEFLHIPAPLTFNIFTWILVVISVLLCQALMLPRSCQKQFAIYVPLLISLPVFSCLLNRDFGQREHLFLILYFPFLVARWLRWSGSKLSSWEAAMVAIPAGIGLSLKPYFLIPAVFIEIFWLADKRTYRPLFQPECYFCALVMAIYAVHFLFLPAAERQSYFGFVAPMFYYGYSFWDVAPMGLVGVGNWGKIFPFVLIAMIVAIYMRKKSSLIVPMIVFALASLISYLLQGKGWSYHPFPCVFAALVLGLIEFWLLLKYLWHKAKFSIDFLLYGIMLITVGIMYHTFVEDIADVKKDDKIDLASLGWPGYSSAKSDLGSFAPALLKRTNQNDRIIVISNGVQPAYPALLQLQRWPGSRHLQALFLSMFDYISDQPSTPDRRRLVGMKQRERVMDEYKEDIQRYSPKLVAIQECALFDYVERFHFVENYLRDYRRVDKFNGFLLYQKR